MLTLKRFKCLRAELKHMVDGGAIVNAASVTGLVGVTKAGTYVASKHAIIGLTKTAAKEVGSRNIRVNASNHVLSISTATAADGTCAR